MIKEQKIHPLDAALLKASALGRYADIDLALKKINEPRKKRSAVVKVSDWIRIARSGEPLGICSRNADGHTALMLAARAGRAPCMMLLLDECNGGPESLAVEREALIEAAAVGNVVFVKAVLERRLKAGLSWTELDVETEWREPMRRCFPVSAAIHSGSEECLSLLISAGFSLGGRVDSLSSTALAIHYDSPKMVRMLLSAGASARQPDDYGVTPLMSAACKGFSEVIHDLLQKGKDASLNDVDVEGMTALGYALRFNKLDSARILSAAGGALDRGRDSLAAAKGRAAVARARLADAIEASAKDSSIAEILVAEPSDSALGGPAWPLLSGPLGPIGPAGPALASREIGCLDFIAEAEMSGNDEPGEPVLNPKTLSDRHGQKERARRLLKASFSG